MRQIAGLLARWEWLILLLLLPAFLFPVGNLPLLLLLIPFIWLARRLTFGRFAPATGYDLAVMIMLIALLISLLVTFDAQLSQSKVVGVIFGVAAFYAAVQYARVNERGAWHIVALILAAGVVVATVGFSVSEAPLVSLAALTRLLRQTLGALSGAQGNLVNPNEIAGVLDWIVPLAWACAIGFFGLLWQAKGMRKRLLPLLALAIALYCTLALIASRSLGGILAAAAACMLMIAVRYRWFLFLMLFGGITATVLLISGAIELPALNTLLRMGTISIQGRVEIWSRAIMALSDTFFTGMSMNGFRVMGPILYPLFTISAEIDIAHAHNQLLQSGLDLGILGLLAYMAMWLISATVLFAAWQRAKDHANRVLILGTAGALTAGWIFGLVDAIALGARPGFIWWLILSLTVIALDGTSESSPATQVNTDQRSPP